MINSPLLIEFAAGAAPPSVNANQQPVSIVRTDPISHFTLSFFSRSHDAVIRVYDAAGNVIETHEHAGDFKEEQPAFEGWRGPNSYSSSVANAIRP